MKNGVTHTILERERMTLKATTFRKYSNKLVTQVAFLASGILGTKSYTSHTNAVLMKHSSMVQEVLAKHIIAVVQMLRATNTLIQ